MPLRWTVVKADTFKVDTFSPGKKIKDKGYYLADILIFSAEIIKNTQARVIPFMSFWEIGTSKKSSKGTTFMYVSKFQSVHLKGVHLNPQLCPP